MEVLIDSGLLKYYTHTVFKYQSFNIIVYFKGDKVIIEWTLYIKITKGYTLQHGTEKIYYRLVRK